MVIYLVTFAISIYLFYKASKAESKYLAAILMVCSILPTAGLAGCRDLSIGTDVLVYGRDVFEDALTCHKYWDFDTLWMVRMEPGFLWLNFLVSRWTGNYHVVLFLLMFIEIGFVEKGLLYFRTKIPVALGLATFYFFYFNVSLNLMRQLFACSIVFYAFRFVVERRLIVYLLWIGFASLFHISGVTAIFIYPLYVIFSKLKSEKMVYLSLLGVVLFAFAIQYTIDSLLAFLGLATKYSHYFSNGSQGLFFTKLLMTLPAPFLFFYLRKSLLEEDSMNYFLLFCLFIMVINSQATEWIGTNADRIFLYYSFFLIVAIPRMLDCFEKGYRIRALIIFSAYMMLYWYYYFIYNGFQETYPYTSRILGWY